MMTTKEMTYQYCLAQWTELAKERVELGLSIRAYCAMKGFAENTYFYWQRRLREAARTRCEAEQAKPAVPGFVEVAVAPAPEAPERQVQTGQAYCLPPLPTALPAPRQTQTEGRFFCLSVCLPSALGEACVGPDMGIGPYGVSGFRAAHRSPASRRARRPGAPFSRTP